MERMESTAQEQAEPRPEAWVKDSDLELKLDEQQTKRSSLWATVCLAYGSLGVIYGDIGTSVIYVFPAIFQDMDFTESTQEIIDKDIFGAISLIFWTLTLITLVKYIGIVLAANDTGEGGTVALYALLCRTMGISPFGSMKSQDFKQVLALTSAAPTGPNRPRLGEHRFKENARAKRREDRVTKHIKPVRPPIFRKSSGFRNLLILDGTNIIRWFRRNFIAQRVLIVITMLATGLVIGDGILMPAFSVVSAINGLRRETNLGDGDIVGISIAILAVLFFFQHIGTKKIGFLFSPIVTVWTMFAAMGHFSRSAIAIAFGLFTYPCIMISYLGQVDTAFWSSIPRDFYWPMLVLATLAAVVASQAAITGTFSLLRQAMAMGIFPKLKIVHTGDIVEGQIFIPVINYILMVLCIAVVAGFQGNNLILAEAYGVAVISVMVLTTFLIILIMITAWETSLLIVIPFACLFLLIESGFLSSSLKKVPHGAWFAVVVSVTFALVMLIWWLGSLWRRRVVLANSKAAAAGDVFSVTTATPRGKIPVGLTDDTTDVARSAAGYAVFGSKNIEDNLAVELATAIASNKRASNAQLDFHRTNTDHFNSHVSQRHSSDRMSAPAGNRPILGRFSAAPAWGRAVPPPAAFALTRISSGNNYKSKNHVSDKDGPGSTPSLLNLSLSALPAAIPPKETATQRYNSFPIPSSFHPLTAPLPFPPPPQSDEDGPGSTPQPAKPVTSDKDGPGPTPNLLNLSQSALPAAIPPKETATQRYNSFPIPSSFHPLTAPLPFPPPPQSDEDGPGSTPNLLNLSQSALPAAIPPKKTATQRYNSFSISSSFHPLTAPLPFPPPPQSDKDGPGPTPNLLNLSQSALPAAIPPKETATQRYNSFPIPSSFHPLTAPLPFSPPPQSDKDGPGPTPNLQNLSQPALPAAIPPEESAKRRSGSFHVRASPGLEPTIEEENSRLTVAGGNTAPTPSSPTLDDGKAKVAVEMEPEEENSQSTAADGNSAPTPSLPTVNDGKAKVAVEMEPGHGMNLGIPNVQTLRLNSMVMHGQHSKPDKDLALLSGLGIYYNETPVGIPEVLRHFLRNVAIFLTVRFLPMPSVIHSERLLVKAVYGVPNFYQVVARYGYQDIVDHGEAFIAQVKATILHKLEIKAGLRKKGVSDDFIAGVEDDQEIEEDGGHGGGRGRTPKATNSMTQIFGLPSGSQGQGHRMAWAWHNLGELALQANLIGQASSGSDLPACDPGVLAGAAHQVFAKPTIPMSAQAGMSGGASQWHEQVRERDTAARAINKTIADETHEDLHHPGSAPGAP
eukprot:gene14146-20109_t